MLTLVVLEAIAILATVALAAWLRLGDEAPSLFRDRWFFAQACLVAVVCQMCLYLVDLYDFRVTADRRELFVRAPQALGATSLILAVIYFWLPELVIGRGVFLLVAVGVVLLVFGWRFAFEWFGARMVPRERLLIVGTAPGAVELARELHNRREFGTHVVGFIDSDPSRVGMPVLNPGVVGTIDDIPSVVRDHGVDRVVVSLTDARGKLPVHRLLDMKLQGIQFDHLASVYEEHAGKIPVDNLRPSWLIFNSGFRKTATLRFAKRAVDIVAGVGGLVLSAPLMLVVGLAVKLTSRGPALFHQRRVGQDGRPFMVHKFRSMQVDAEAKSGPVWATGSDARVTPIGGILRRTRLDELPQLWNVLVGEMSLVGPRPERPEFVSSLTEQIPFYGQRHVVKPGVTGWAQVSYTYGASVEDAMEKLQYDLFYIKHLSIAFDLFIILKTVKTVLMRKGSR